MRIHPEGGQRISLRRLLPEADLLGADDIWVTSCSCDSRHVRPGDLFVALPGNACDGHDFVAEAARRGATAVMAQRPLPETIPAQTCSREFTRRCFACDGSGSVTTWST